MSATADAEKMAWYFDPNPKTSRAAPVQLTGPGVWHGPMGDAFDLQAGMSAWGGGGEGSHHGQPQPQPQPQPHGRRSGWGGGGVGRTSTSTSTSSDSGSRYASGWGGGGPEHRVSVAGGGGGGGGWGGADEVDAPRSSSSSSHSAAAAATATAATTAAAVVQPCVVPIVNVSGRLFEVETVWIEEAFALLDPTAPGYMACGIPDMDLSAASHTRLVGGCDWEMNASRPRVSNELVDVIVRLILAIDTHDRDHCRASSSAGSSYKAVLVFMPGFGEIQSLMRALEPWCGRSASASARAGAGAGYKHHDGKLPLFVAVPLHSQVAREEQQQAFATFPHQRKVIISTNIAESSVTVPDVRYVIDVGMSKERCYDQTSNLESLQSK
jgi:hypothetical protein